MSDTPATVPAPPPDAMAPHLSPFRMLVAAVLIVGLVAGGSKVARTALHEQAATTGAWFAPYVDVSSTPQFDFQDPEASPATNVVLSFVVAKQDDHCTPAWGAQDTLDSASTTLDLDRRITLLRERGGDVIVSFGGAANHELADVCTDPSALADAYRAVVSRYRLTTIDLDLEGVTLGDAAAMKRRATAIAQVQGEQRRAGKHLAVWLTLPMTSSGLQPEGVAAIDAMLAGKVDLAGVNVMAMEFGNSRPAGMSFAAASLAGIDATATQLVGSYRRIGKRVTRSEAYHHVGVTPMIGQNIFPADILDVDGAEALHKGALSRGVKRFSMWSLNRDRQCAGNIDSTVVNDICSGVSQTTMQFSRIFGAGASPLAQDQQVKFATSNQVRNRQDGPVADGSTGPYDVWRPHREYEAGVKVVWHARVFAAKWWNVGDPPDALVQHDWDSPWSLIGPVLPTDTGPAPLPTVPPHTYPDWSSIISYDAGTKVERHGVGYEAKWATRGEDPAADVDNPWETPWEVITADGSTTSGS